MDGPRSPHRLKDETLSLIQSSGFHVRDHHKVNHKRDLSEIDLARLTTLVRSKWTPNSGYPKINP